MTKLAFKVGEDCCEDARKMRGRPRCTEKNDAIRLAAGGLFLEKGFDGTSMDEVARRAEVSKQTVYSHFSCKDDLFIAAIQARIDESMPENTIEDLHNVPLKEALFGVASQFADLLLSADSVAVFRLLAASAAKGPHLAELFYHGGAEAISQRLERFLQIRADAGELDIKDVHVAATQFISLLKGELHFCWAIGLIDSIGEKDLKIQIDQTVDAFMRIYACK